MGIGYRRARVNSLWNLHVNARVVPAHYSVRYVTHFSKGHDMEISVSEEVQAQLDQVKEWMESKIGREVTYNDVLLQILKNFQDVLYPEDLGSA
jgi:hypothetical protein